MSSTLMRTGRDYCEHTSVHGFAYWVAADQVANSLQRALWAVVTLTSFTFAGVVLYGSIKGWIEDPTVVAIDTFSEPATNVAYPSITVCGGPNQFDATEYVRSVFNAFQLACSPGNNETGCGESERIRADFVKYFGIEKDTNSFAVMFSESVKNWVHHAQKRLRKREKNGVIKAHVSPDALMIIPYIIAAGGSNLSDHVDLLLREMIAGMENWPRWELLLGVRVRDPTSGRMAKHKSVHRHLSSSCDEYTSDGVRHRYYEMCKHVKENGHIWKRIAKCAQQKYSTSKSFSMASFDYVNSTDNSSCLNEEVGPMVEKRLLANLTDFDTYLFSHWMARHGTFNVLSLKKELLNPAQHHQLENYCMESKLCKSKEVLEQAEAIMLKLKFFQSLWLPEENLGTMIASLPSTDMGSVGQEGDSGNTTAVLKTQMWSNLMTAGFRASLSAKEMPNTEDGFLRFSHPSHIAERYRINPISVAPYDTALDVEGLAKLLSFGHYLKARANTTDDAKRLIVEEAAKYGYPLRNDMPTPYFSGHQHNSGCNAHTMHAAITDSGLCDVLNGNTLKSTYRRGYRADTLADAFDHRRDMRPEKIEGTGHTYRKTFWLYVGDKSMRSRVPHEPRSRGAVRLAINDWTSYFNVRTNHLRVAAGEDVRFTLRPVVHATSDGFRALDPEERKCFFRDEPTAAKGMFNYYERNACLFECRLRHAMKTTNCLPWDYPEPLNQTLNAAGRNICVIDDHVTLPSPVRAFDRAMGSADATKGCSCPSNCEEVVFETQVNTVTLDSSELCKTLTNRDTFDMVMKDWRLTHSPLVHWANQIHNHHYKQLDKNFSPADISHFAFEHGLTAQEAFRVCQMRFKLEFARVSVVIADPNIMKIRKSVRMTFEDQLGVLGGTLGLFTGASLISSAEALFWLQKVIVRLIFGEKKAR